MRSSVILIMLSLGACSNPLCTNQTVASLPSPDRKHEAILFMRECGATTDFSTQISLDPSPFQSIGNIFVADAYNGGTRGEWGGPWAEMNWIAPNKLAVNYDEQARVFNRITSVHGVEIVFRPIRRQ